MRSKRDRGWFVDSCHIRSPSSLSHCTHNQPSPSPGFRAFLIYVFDRHTRNRSDRATFTMALERYTLRESCQDLGEYFRSMLCSARCLDVLAPETAGSRSASPLEGSILSFDTPVPKYSSVGSTIASQNSDMSVVRHPGLLTEGY
jgi:hypothetical protein